MGTYSCDGCGLLGLGVFETIAVAGRFRFCSACHPVCCVCRRSAGEEETAALEGWRVNGFRINNRQFICFRCRIDVARR